MTDNVWTAGRSDHRKWPDMIGQHWVAVFKGGENAGSYPFGSEAEAEALIEQINRPAPLPVGVYRKHCGDTWLVGGHPMPEGWRYDGPNGRIVPIPPAPPAPETEMVPWYQAKGRTHTDGWAIRVVSDGASGPNAKNFDGGAFALADEDGMIRVQVEK